MTKYNFLYDIYFLLCYDIQNAQCCGLAVTLPFLQDLLSEKLEFQEWFVGSHNTLAILTVILFCRESKACIFLELNFFAYNE